MRADGRVVKAARSSARLQFTRVGAPQRTCRTKGQRVRPHSAVAFATMHLLNKVIKRSVTSCTRSAVRITKTAAVTAGAVNKNIASAQLSKQIFRLP
jgi:hypothetical protein